MLENKRKIIKDKIKKKQEEEVGYDEEEGVG